MLELFGHGLPSLLERDWVDFLPSLVQEISKSSKIYITIDGLDEIGGDLEELCSLISQLASLKNVKLCVSSRPWSEFEDAFGDKPRLLLQDLTWPDITAYVQQKLNKSRYFTQLSSESPEITNKLIADIVDKSSGVFLWVALVVKSILEGLRDVDLIEELNQRLDDLPSDLDKLFERILGGLKESHMNGEKKYFDIMEAHNRTGQLPITVLFFADQPCPTYVIKQPIAPSLLSHWHQDTMSRRINSRCRGLLEISKSKYVGYLHRTVADYIKTPHARQMMSRESSQSHDAQLLLSAGYLASIKSLTDDASRSPAFTILVTRCLHFASLVEARSFEARDLLLDELHKSGKELAKRVAPHEGYSNEQRLVLGNGLWVLDSPPVLDHGSIVLGAQYFFGRTFLSLIIRHGITDYIQSRVQRGCLVQRVGEYAARKGVSTIVWPLLLDILYGYREGVVPMSLLQELLAHGADPTFKPQWAVVTRESPLIFAQNQVFQNKEEVITEMEKHRQHKVLKRVS